MGGWFQARAGSGGYSVRRRKEAGGGAGGRGRMCMCVPGTQGQNTTQNRSWRAVAARGAAAHLITGPPAMTDHTLQQAIYNSLQISRPVSLRADTFGRRAPTSSAPPRLGQRSASDSWLIGGSQQSGGGGGARSAKRTGGTLAREGILPSAGAGVPSRAMPPRTRRASSSASAVASALHGASLDGDGQQQHPRSVVSRPDRARGSSSSTRGGPAPYEGGDPQLVRTINNGIQRYQFLKPSA